MDDARAGDGAAAEVRAAVARLAAFDVAAYVAAAREKGRAALGLAVREEAAELSFVARRLDADHRNLLSESERRLVDLARVVFEPEEFFSTEPVPRYRHYANVAVLMHVAGLTERAPLAVTFGRVREAIALLTRELQLFQQRVASGEEPHSRRGFDPEQMATRERRLEKVLEIAFRTNIGDAATTPWEPPTSLVDYTGPDALAQTIRFLTLFPQTDYFDEVVFLRTIHISELSFFGAALAVWEARSRVLFGDLDEACALTLEAVRFLEILVPLFGHLYTMPPQHFAHGFRDATGNASAIQSRGYQLLDALSKGVTDDAKVAALLEHPEVRSVLTFRGERFTPFFDMVNLIDDAHPAAAELFAAKNSLVRRLGSWRNLHTRRSEPEVGYLPPAADGTGGTAGYSYLRDQSFPSLGQPGLVEVPYDGLRAFAPGPAPRDTDIPAHLGLVGSHL